MWKSPTTELPEINIRVNAIYQSFSQSKPLVAIAWLKPLNNGYGKIGKTQWVLTDGIKGTICVPATTILWWCEIPKFP